MEDAYVIGVTDASLSRSATRGARSTPMSQTRSETCYLCSNSIPHTPGTSIVEVTLERDTMQHAFHLNCFVAFTTGAPRDGDIWTYRIMATPGGTEAGP
jgi:hypothetical protein